MTFEHVFRLQLGGVSLPSQQKFNVPERQLTAKLDPGAPMRLAVSLTNVSEPVADQRANDFAQTLYFRLLLRFGSRITNSEPPSLLGKTVVTDDSVSATAVAVKLPPLTVAFVGSVATPLSQGQLDELVADIQLRFAIPELPTSAPLYAAIGMFAAGMEAQNAVVRFLVLYSALTLQACSDGTEAVRRTWTDFCWKEITRFLFRLLLPTQIGKKLSIPNSETT